MADRIEADIQRIGQEILNRLERESPSIFRRDFWHGKIMDWSMRDEDFKVQMFRFVDVFPVLRTPEQLARHVQEYFCGPEHDFPAWIQLGLRSVSASSLLARHAAAQIEKNIRGLAGTFIAGESPTAALPRLEAMRGEDIAFSVDLLGEATVSEKEAEEYQRRYLDLLKVIAERAAQWRENPRLDGDDQGTIPRANVSIKMTALDPHIDPADFEGSLERARERLRPIFRLARDKGVFLNLDMEQYEVKDLTLALFRSILEDPEFVDVEHAGIAVQAYLTDSYGDLESLIEWARKRQRRVTVRLVKGAYWDYETIHAQQQGWPVPVYQRKWSTDANYERCTELMLRNHAHIRCAFGSHNARSLAGVLAWAEQLGVPHNGYEIQMLYGTAEPMRKALLSMGVRLRDYVPVGELVPGMAYLVRRLLENTSNEGFLRARFVEQADPERLLARPAGRHETEPEPPEAEFHNQPRTDFAIAERRREVRSALGRVRSQLGREWPLVIGGERRMTERTLRSVNPADPDEVAGVTACAGIAETEAAISAAEQAFEAWRRRGVEERAGCLRAIAEEMRSRRDDLSAWMVLEVGKQWREADADVAEAIDFCNYYAQCAERMMQPVRLGHYPGELNHLLHQPMGVAAVIAPWNFPLAILTGMTVAALVTGNTAIIKPAEQSSVVGAQFAEVCRVAGLPPGVVNYLPGLGEEIGAHLVTHPRTRIIAFTGSRQVGLQILRHAYDSQPTQPGVKRVVCEMGGKNAIIVDGDADLDEAVAAVLYSAFGYQGQKCSACSRVIVLPENYDAFVARLVEATRSLRIGPAEDPACRLGPLVDEEAREKVLRYEQLGREEGVPLFIGDAPGGCYAPPAVFGEITTEHRLAREEIFGPVLAVMRAEDFDDALRIANSTSFALTGAVISRSPENIDKARRAFQVGNLYINRGSTGALVYRQPFGGFKFSGLGHKAGGPDYLLQFVESRAVSENAMRRGFAPSV